MAKTPKPPPRNYRIVQRKYDAQTRRILELAARRIRASIRKLRAGTNADQIRAAQLRLVLAEINRILRGAFVDDMEDVLRNGRRDAAITAQDALETLSRTLYTALPRAAANALRDGLRLQAAGGIEADYARIPRQLSSRVYRNADLVSGRVEDTIRTGLVRGLSAREMADEVYRYISPTTPGGASYAALRLARTEINNAFHEQQIRGAQQPGVKSVTWNLSGSHVVPDECNVYAERNLYRLGPGQYPRDKVPDKPHPQCFCFLSYVMMRPQEFARELNSGTFDDRLERRMRENLERMRSTPPRQQGRRRR